MSVLRGPEAREGRWQIERLFDWFQNFRRLVVRYERFAENSLGMLHLACRLVLLRGEPHPGHQVEVDLLSPFLVVERGKPAGARASRRER